jgi:hypothetical protein
MYSPFPQVTSAVDAFRKSHSTTKERFQQSATNRLPAKRHSQIMTLSGMNLLNHDVACRKHVV